MKTCKRCEIQKPVEEFYTGKKGTKTYLHPYCKSCFSLYTKERRQTEEGSKRLSEQSIRHYHKIKHTARYKERIARNIKKSREKWPEKFKARSTLREAVRRGKIAKQNCSSCGSTKSEGHHPDYSKPLEVIWLCRRHHVDWHRAICL